MLSQVLQRVTRTIFSHLQGGRGIFMPGPDSRLETVMKIARQRNKKGRTLWQGPPFFATRLALCVRRFHNPKSFNFSGSGIPSSFQPRVW